MIGVRGLHEAIVATFGETPHRGSSLLAAQATAILAPSTTNAVASPPSWSSMKPPAALRAVGDHPDDDEPQPRRRLPLACLLVGQPTLRRTMNWLS